MPHCHSSRCAKYDDRHHSPPACGPTCRGELVLEVTNAHHSLYTLYPTPTCEPTCRGRWQYVSALTFVTFLTRSLTVLETPPRTRERGLGKPLNAAIAGSSSRMYCAVPGNLLTDFCTTSKLVLNFCRTRNMFSETVVLHHEMLHEMPPQSGCLKLHARTRMTIVRIRFTGT